LKKSIPEEGPAAERKRQDAVEDDDEVEEADADRGYRGHGLRVKKWTVVVIFKMFSLKIGPKNYIFCSNY
jgi:hypothetical protein